MSGPSLAQKVSNIKHMPVLLAATSATKDPADGYMVKDIIKMSYESHQTRVFLQQYLVNQLLTTNNVYSKIKILRLFLDLLEEGHIEFKQNLRRTPEPFNEAAKLRPHQPKDQKLAGECGRIRDMANKVLDVLYSEVPELRRTNQTMDSGDYAGGMDSTGNSSSRITGFGNTTAPKPSTTDKLKALFGTTGSKSGPIVYDPSYATMDPVPHNSSANTPFSVHVPSSGYKDSEKALMGLPHERGQAGGGWGTSDQSPVTSSKSKWSASTYQSRAEWGVARQEEEEEEEEEEEQREHLSSTGEDLSAYQRSSGSEQEQRLVDEITAPGGVKIAPPKESLNKFVARCKGLDSLSVVECLRLKLLSEESQTVLRALFIIEHLLRSDIPDILSHLDIVLQDLSDLSTSSNSSVQAKAKKISVQLASANEQKVSSRKAAASSVQLTSSNGREEAEEGEDQEEEETPAISSIFSGLSVSGEKATRRSRPAKRDKKKQQQQQQQQPSLSSSSSTTPRAAKKGAGSTRSTEKREEERKGFEDILGLGDLSTAGAAPPSDQPLPSTGEVAMDPQQLLDPQLPADDSLLTFEEDLEFDPLKRSDSVTRTGSVSSKGRGTVGKATPTTSQQQQPIVESSSKPAEPHPPLVSQTSLGHIQDLTGVDLSSVTGGGMTTGTTTRQDSLSELLHPLPASGTMTSSSVGVAPMQFVAAPSSVAMAPQGQMPFAMQPGGVVYGGVPTQGQVPLTMQTGTGGVAYGGGAPPMVPVMYATQGSTGIMYQPQFGGMARPVQRAAVAKEQTPPPDTGFSFLGKSNKSSAFDFVQDEMKASGSRTKK